MTTPDPLRAALTEWDAIEGSDLGAQFRAIIAAGKMADAIRAALAADTAPHYTEADRQAAYAAGWDDARAVIAEPLDVERLRDAMYDANQQHAGYECCAPSTHADAERIAAEYLRLAKERDQG